MKIVISILALFCISFSAFAQTDRDQQIVSCFYQGSANNCASVALIKAAMIKYGYKNIFTVTITNNSYQIQLKDGTLLTISEEEKKLAEQYAKFNIKEMPELGQEQNNVLLYAYLGYASIAKSIVKNGYWGCVEQGNPHYTDIKTYKNALWFISRKSFCTDNCHKLLGYKIKENKIYDFKHPEDIDQKGVILYSWGHAVVTYKTQLDCHGRWDTVSTADVCDNKFEWYIVLD